MRPHRHLPLRTTDGPCGAVEPLGPNPRKKVSSRGSAHLAFSACACGMHACISPPRGHLQMAPKHVKSCPICLTLPGAARRAQSARNERRVRPSYRPAYHVSPGFGDRCSRACASALHGCAAGERPPQPPKKGSTDWRGAGSREGITHQGHRSYTASPSRDESAALGRGPGARPPEGVMGGARHGVGTRLRAGGGTKSLPREFGETLIWSPDTTLSL